MNADNIPDAPAIYCVKSGENDFLPGAAVYNVLRRDDTGKLHLVISMHDADGADDLAFILNEAHEARTISCN